MTEVAQLPHFLRRYGLSSVSFNSLHGPMDVLTINIKVPLPGDSYINSAISSLLQSTLAGTHTHTLFSVMDTCLHGGERSSAEPDISSVLLKIPGNQNGEHFFLKGLE